MEIFMKNNVNAKTYKMVQMAILIAIMLIFAFTPIGYIKFGAIEITLMVIPVAVGAIVLGPTCGAILGGIFGATSFVQCFGISAFGTFLFSLNPVMTFITCIVPRILCGWLAALIFQAIYSKGKKTLAAYTASLSTALLNTIFFMGCIIMFFWSDAGFVDQMAAWGVTTKSVGLFLVAFVGVNGVVEAVVNFIVGGAISQAVLRYRNKK